MPERNLVHADFLTVSPDRFDRPMNVILGNPPYVRHQLLDAAAIERGIQVSNKVGVDLPRRADLWAYIVIHSLQFLDSGGRLGLLLPGAVLQSDYSRPVLAALEDRFRSVDLIHVRERLFTDASERTVVLLADGFDRERRRRVDIASRR